MADSYIDKLETLLYGRFSAAQILALVVGLDAELDPAAKVMAARITAVTDVMEGVLKKAGEVDLISYAAAGATPGDPVAEARRALRRVNAYVESRDNGAEIAADLLNGENLTTVVKRRPVKLAGALDGAIKAIEKHNASLPEADAWKLKLTAARDALHDLNTSVRKARSDRRAMTPEIADARARWLVVYTSAKEVIAGILRQHGKQAILHEIFDDLAEIHHVAGVIDEPPQGGGASEQPH